MHHKDKKDIKFIFTLFALCDFVVNYTKLKVVFELVSIATIFRWWI
jgi:hypothetical protein